MGPSALSPPSYQTSPALFRAEVKAWTSEVVGRVVDHSIDQSRKLREEAAARRAERQADEERAAAREARMIRMREEAEARDARRLAERNRTSPGA
jgi:hypothetical protein